MRIRHSMVGLLGRIFVVSMLMSAYLAHKVALAGCSASAPRDEINPQFRFEPAGGRDGHAAFVISGDEREGTSGWWQKTFEVEGAKTYRFAAWRKPESVDSPRQSGLARVQWRDANGKTVKRDEPTAGRYLHGS